MSAKEMFKLEGYTGYSTKVFSHYSKYISQTKSQIIDIDLRERKVEKLIITANTERVCKEYTFEEIKAINKIIEELECNKGSEE